MRHALRLILFLFLSANNLYAVPTYFGSDSSPADNGSQDGTAARAVIPPVSMSSGDLVVVYGQYRGAVTITVNNAAGQTWNTLTEQNTTNADVQIFWARFNGTWVGNPEFVTSTLAGQTFSIVMHVFRPAVSSSTWGIDTGITSNAFAAPGSPFTVTRTGVVTTNADTVTIAGWHIINDNTFSSLTGSGWNQTGLAQYRNGAGTDQALSFAHYLASSSATNTGNVSQNQSAGAAGLTTIVGFYEIPSGPTPTPTNTPTITPTFTPTNTPVPPTPTFTPTITPTFTPTNTPVPPTPTSTPTETPTNTPTPTPTDTPLPTFTPTNTPVPPTPTTTPTITNTPLPGSRSNQYLSSMGAS